MMKQKFVTWSILTVFENERCSLSAIRQIEQFIANNLLIMRKVPGQVSFLCILWPLPSTTFSCRIICFALESKVQEQSQRISEDTDLYMYRTNGSGRNNKDSVAQGDWFVYVCLVGIAAAASLPKQAKGGQVLATVCTRIRDLVQDDDDDVLPSVQIVLTMARDAESEVVVGMRWTMVQLQNMMLCLLLLWLLVYISIQRSEFQRAVLRWMETHGGFRFDCVVKR